MNVVEFYSKVMSLWSELEGHIRCPQCTCKKCERDIGGQVAKLFEEEKTHQFLLGLNDEIFYQHPKPNSCPRTVAIP